jgi:hypothetical protein
MIMGMEYWTQEQWLAFTGLSVSGVAAVALLTMGLRAMRAWTAPAPLRFAPAHAMPERRALAVKRAPAWAAEAGWTDPMRTDYTDPGIGALSSIRAVAADPALVTGHERQATEEAWIHAYDDLSGRMPETDRAAETMRVNLEPAMRKARLWLMQAGEIGAKAVLNTWRMDTPTGEYPNPFLITQPAVAAALLES